MMKKLKDLTNEELLEVAHLFINRVHSDGFKIAEAKDFLSPDYECFGSTPKENWKENTIKYLTDNGYELPSNRLFTPIITDYRNDPSGKRRFENPALYQKTVEMQNEFAKNGIAWHNPFSDECTSDFCCCTGKGNYNTYFPSYQQAIKDESQAVS